MTLTVSNNSAVAFASHYLGENQRSYKQALRNLPAANESLEEPKTQAPYQYR